MTLFILRFPLLSLHYHLSINAKSNRKSAVDQLQCFLEWQKAAESAYFCNQKASMLMLMDYAKSAVVHGYLPFSRMSTCHGLFWILFALSYQDRL